MLGSTSHSTLPLAEDFQFAISHSGSNLTIVIAPVQSSQWAVKLTRALLYGPQRIHHSHATMISAQ